MRPVDINVCIVPYNASVTFRMIIICRLINKLSRITQHQKSVCKPFRDPKLSFIFSRKIHTNPFPKRWRRFTNINRNIKNFTSNTTYQFALRIRFQLVMQATQNAFAGFRVVILHKLDFTTYRLFKYFWLKLSKKKPRSSPNTFGSKISTSGISVLITFIS